MRNKEDLFNLIKAMSKSEKRYFVLDAKKSGRSASRYLTLFETLGKMEEFDEEKLKKKFPQNLPSDKAYLYEAILRSMRDYRSASSKAAQVKERLMDARFLYERGLYDQSNARILEAKSMAKELEDNFSLLEIIKEEQQSLYDRRVRVDLEMLEKIQKEKEEILVGIHEEMDYLNLYFTLIVEVYKEGTFKDKKSIDAFNQRFPSESLAENHLPASALSKRRFYLCNAIYFRLLGKKNKIYENYLRAVDWWEKYPAFKSEEFNRYVSDIANLVNTCYDDEELLPEAQKWLGKLKEQGEARNYHERKYIFLYLSVSNLLHLMNHGNFIAAKDLLPEIIKGIEQFNLKRSIVLIGNILIVYFVLGDYENCIIWADQVINLKNSTREDIQRVARLLKLIALYELGEIDEVENSFRATNRYFKKTNLADDRFEQIILNGYLKNIFNAPVNDLKKCFENFLEFLLLEEKKSGNKKPLGFDEILIWVKNKLNYRT